MRCIFCLENRSGSEEHVFPLAIGGRLTTDRVCQPCNSTLGSRVDGALTNSFLVQNRRAALGLAGNSGKRPAIYDLLLGTSKLAEQPGWKVRTTFNKAAGKLDTRAVAQAVNIVMPDGTKAAQIVVDARDAGQIPMLIQRARKRHGLPPASAEQLAVDIEKMSKSVTAIENPKSLSGKKLGDFERLSYPFPRN